MLETIARKLYPNEPRFIRLRKVKLKLLLASITVGGCLLAGVVVYWASTADRRPSGGRIPTRGLGR